MFLKQLRPAIISLFVLTVLTGLVYPLLVTGLAQLIFPDKANGSILMKDGRAVGSGLIGQQFNDARYFWSRPSATAPFAYNAGASTASNIGPLNPALKNAVEERIRSLRAADPQNAQAIPVDLVTASGSGLDPHISVAAALYQLPRVAHRRKMSEGTLRLLIDSFTDERQFGFLGEPRVNVLKLNLALDETQPISESK